MSFLIPIAMFGYLPFVLWLYGKLPPRRAALVAFITAWMFLPNDTYYFPGLPDYNKTFAASLAVLLATFLRDRGRLAAFRWRLYDGVLLFWCLTPMLSSLSNGLGAYDGFSNAKNYLTTWFAPYLIGRLYFGNREAIRDLLWGLFLGALVYSPFCWLEMVMSPQLHNWVYGHHAHIFSQTVRPIGYRPTVFMQHGLMVGMWMAGGALAGLILWKWDGTVKTVFGFPLRTLVIVVVVTAVACQSFGAIGLLGAGYLIITLCRKLRFGLPLKLVALLPVLAVSMKVAGLWTGEGMVNFFSKISEERAASFEFRALNEEMLIEKALARPVFGWGGWGRSRIYDEAGNDISITDSYWIIIFGQSGITGLVSFALVMTWPVIGFLRRYPPKTWAEPAIARAVPLVTLVALYFVDCLVNDMKSPLYILIAGAIATLVAESTGRREWDLISPMEAGPRLAPVPLLPRVL